VASFIGTPPTNFFHVTIEKDGAGYAAVNSSLRFKVPSALEQALAPYTGKEVILGVRPEFLGMSVNMEKTESYLCDTVIRFVEPQGNFSILIANVGGEEIKIVSSDRMEIPVNTAVSLNVKEGEAMFFDPASGLRIR
jgi:multiple sugar transport system ATP-binding protein